MSLTKQQHSLGPTDIAPSSYGCSELGSTLVAQVPPPPIHGNGRCEPTPSRAKRAQAVASVSLINIHGEVDRGRDSHGVAILHLQRGSRSMSHDRLRDSVRSVGGTALILDRDRRDWQQGTPGIRITTTAPLRAPSRRSRIFPGPVCNPIPQAQRQPHRSPPPRGAAAHPEMDPFPWPPNFAIPNFAIHDIVHACRI